MQDQVNMVMLVCAVVAALAFGVLVGYATCKGFFTMLRTHARSLEAERAKTSVVSTIGS
jgi:uncharacterized protein (DUF2062 family)